MKIRPDLIGVVVVRDADYAAVTLRAGDEVPEGVTVGDHLTAAEASSYSSMKKADLLAEIERRNADRDDADKIESESDKNADLVAALEADDAVDA